MSYLCPHCKSFQFADGRLRLVVRDLWRKIQLDTNKQALCGANRRKVMIRPRSSERMQSLCENLISALNLMAKQQEDGDGLIQNIVTNLCEGRASRRV